MGNATSSTDPRHVRIWQNLASMSDEARIQMLETLMAGQEYVTAAKRTGVYAFVLQWIAAYRRGERPSWPGARPVTYNAPISPTASYGPPMPSSTAHRTPPVSMMRESGQYMSQVSNTSHPSHTMLPIMNEPRKVVKEHTLATVPPPKRALDTLHESYRILGIDDTKPLNGDILRLAYKKAAAKAHPDRGGTPETFDAVTRAFLYLEEVLNKLIPKGATEGDDPRFTQAVTKEVALKARDGPLTKYDAEEQARGRGDTRALEEPKIALNPKNLNLSVFNKLFEENRLPDPDQDGYGDWLKSNGEDRRLQNESQLRSKFNADVFNRTFVEQGTRAGDGSALQKYQSPDAITHHGGVELGAGRPQHYISPMGAKTGYTDLKFAYGQGSTFSQEVAGVQEGKRSLDAMKRERESAPVPLTAEEQRMLEAIERQKAAAEEERRRRVAVHDIAAEDTYSRLQRRMAIQ
jgi:hypothetical protein